MCIFRQKRQILVIVCLISSNSHLFLTDPRTLRTVGAARCTVNSVVVCIKAIAVINKMLAQR